MAVIYSLVAIPPIPQELTPIANGRHLRKNPYISLSQSEPDFKTVA